MENNRTDTQRKTLDIFENIYFNIKAKSIQKFYL